MYGYKFSENNENGLPIIDETLLDAVPEILQVEPSDDIEKADSPELKLIQDKCPHIFSQIKKKWGTYFLQEKFSKWIFSDQTGREGWPEGIYAAILTTSNTHHKIFDFQAK